MLFIDMLVKGNKKGNLFSGAVSILGMAPTAVGPLYPTWRPEVRISKYRGFEVKWHLKQTLYLFLQLNKI